MVRILLAKRIDLIQSAPVSDVAKILAKQTGYKCPPRDADMGWSYTGDKRKCACHYWEDWLNHDITGTEGQLP